jgi:pimeloyl-ACP methyl ester carboxylesterase
MPPSRNPATVPAPLVVAAGAHVAHRRLGPSTGTPLVLLQRFRGTMDDWDPAVVDGLAAERPVVLFDAPGIGRSTGETPDTIAGMARDALAVLDALALTRVDVLGFCLGGMIAQQILFDRPASIRRAVLAGTGGPGAAGMFNPEVTLEAMRVPVDPEALMLLLFRPTAAAHAAARRHRERTTARAGRGPEAGRPTLRAQLAAIRAWGETNGEVFARLKRIEQPVLVVNGTHDVVIPSFNAYALSQQIPGAQLILYPDAGHGALFQYPEWFVHDALRFLARE